MSECYWCGSPCICRHLGEVMTQPQRASVTLSAIVNEFSTKLRFANSIKDLESPVTSSKLSFYGAWPRDLGMPDPGRIEITGLGYWLPQWKSMYNGDRPFDPVSGDYLDTKRSDIERPAGLSSGVAISSRLEQVNELMRAGVIGYDTGDYEFSAGDASTNALPKFTVDECNDYDDYSDFLDNDDCEDDDE